MIYAYEVNKMIKSYNEQALWSTVFADTYSMLAGNPPSKRVEIAAKAANETLEAFRSTFK